MDAQNSQQAVNKQESYSTSELNNTGATLIRQRRYSQAINYLSAAFHQCKSRFEEKGQCCHKEDMLPLWPGSVDLWMLRDDDLPNQRYHHGDHTTTTREEGGGCCSYQHHDEETQTFVYTQPIHIPPRAKIVSELNVAVAATFNLALAYHLAAFDHCETTAQGMTQRSRQEAMKQALRLYQYTFRLQRTQAKSSESPRFFMACINNIGILFHSLDEPEKAAECFGHLLALLMYLSTVGMADPIQLESYLQNTTKLSYDTCAQGAAAA